MTQQQFEDATALSNRISELRERLITFDKLFANNGTGHIHLLTGSKPIAEFRISEGVPTFVEDFLAAYRRHLIAALKAAEMEFENI
ncbi:MAG: hypothetical protein ACR2K1_14110 [Saprospiraceae bacterium]